MIPAGLARALADRYRLERELGRGGMATVYLADDLKHRRKVAIKFMHPELAVEIGPARFICGRSRVGVAGRATRGTGVAWRGVGAVGVSETTMGAPLVHRTHCGGVDVPRSLLRCGPLHDTEPQRVGP